jgi:diguanylate cyclase (GGDEF)-like protein
MNIIHIVALQLLLYAALWVAASIGWRQELRSTLMWMMYSLVAGVAFLLIAARPDGPAWLTHSVASGFYALGLVFARLGVEYFLRLKIGWLEYIIVVSIGLLGLLWINPLDDVPRVALVSLLSALVLAGAALTLWTPMKKEFGLPFTSAAAVPVAFMLVLNLLLGLRALLGLGAQTGASGNTSAAVWAVTLVSAAVFNFLFLFLLAKRMKQSLERMATHDALTGLLNRRGMQALLNTQWQHAKRNATPFAVISLDVDHFKKVNDTFGHDAGDKVLAMLGALLQQELRGTDQAARMGGEEFLVLLPGCTAAAQGMQLANRLKAALAASTVDLGPHGIKTVTASWGVADVQTDDADLEAVLRRADNALYEAKRSGRDRVVPYSFGLQQSVTA